MEGNNLVVESRFQHQFIVDADVLIDYLKTDRSILKLVSKYIGEIFVVPPILNEVKNIDSSDELLELGIVVIEPDMEDVINSNKPGRLSFQDQICMLTAKRHGLTLVTNEKPLLNTCKKEKIPVIRGLRLLIILYEKDHLTGDEALDVVKKIQKVNPRYIHEKILIDFSKKIGL